MSFVALARSDIFVYMGYTIDMRMAMIANTTINSISVKARAKWEFLAIDLLAWGPMIFGGLGSESQKELRKRKMLDNALSSSCM